MIHFASFFYRDPLAVVTKYMVIDQVRGKDGWILVKFFFFACLQTETESRSINVQDKNEANIQPFWSSKLGQFKGIIT